MTVAGKSEREHLDAIEASQAPERALEGMELLVVDDDPDAIGMLQIILSDRGARVRTAVDVESALHMYDELPPDVLVSDVGMAGRDGYDLIRAVRERDARARRHTPAIALTSFSREQDRRQAVATGFDSHCAKTLRPLNLIQQIRHVLATRC